MNVAISRRVDDACAVHAIRSNDPENVVSVSDIVFLSLCPPQAPTSTKSPLWCCIPKPEKASRKQECWHAERESRVLAVTAIAFLAFAVCCFVPAATARIACPPQAPRLSNLMTAMQRLNKEMVFGPRFCHFVAVTFV